jgi:radical SAM superfamily enzyme YgiQ (UPF0313 family)
MYKGTGFRIRKVEDIKEDLDMALEAYGPGIRSVFFPDGNTILMKTEQLEEIFNYTRQLFPLLERITVYGSARFVNLKSLDELKRLNRAGLKRVHMGMESGDDEVLVRLKKGAAAREVVEAGKKAIAAGIELSMYYLVGSGGIELWQQHAINSGKVLSEINPHFIRLRTLVPDRGTPLYQDWEAGSFTLPRAHQALREVRLMIEHLTGTGEVLSDHISNYWNVHGSLPQDKEKMLAQIDGALAIPEQSLRRSDLRRL